MCSSCLQSLLSGCIPVTFFREHDNPWSSHLDYAQFSINIDPARIHALQPTLEAVLQNKAALTQLQHNVARVQVCLMRVFVLVIDAVIARDAAVKKIRRSMMAPLTGWICLPERDGM